MIERIPAAKYYGVGKTGWVVLVNGYPIHFTGKSAAKDSDVYYTKKRWDNVKK